MLFFTSRDMDKFTDAFEAVTGARVHLRPIAFQARDLKILELGVQYHSEDFPEGVSDEQVDEALSRLRPFVSRESYPKFRFEPFHSAPKPSEESVNALLSRLVHVEAQMEAPPVVKEVLLMLADGKQLSAPDRALLREVADRIQV